MVGRSIELWHVGENFFENADVSPFGFFRAGRKLLSVDFLLTTGTGYDDFLKLYLLDVDIVSGKRDDKYLGESF